MENRYSGRITLIVISLSLVLMIGMLLPGSGYGQFQPGQKRTVAVDEGATIKGVILSRDGETFVLRDISRSDTVVVLTDSTKIRTERKGLFRGHKPFDMTALLPGLILQAKGKGDSQGRLVAEDITFSEADLKAAITSYAQTAPVEKQLTETDKKLEETSKEVLETNKRISSLDQYDVVKTVTVLFKVNSAKLGAQQKAQLDELASKAPGAKNYTVEVKGFADSTGDFQKNLGLSQRRADAVVQYLTVKHNIPLRRITVPMGYGETKPAGDDKTAAGRQKDRRVEVSVLVNKGLSQ
ncbi:MAG: Outer membrane porin F precursor [Syntrophorhabdus sp. PtaU1.Bin002]|nr:MAG: Outer membrane porin F precursor [Syntrophorhabdus sp. PtaB.Bin006]OPY62571.1 MAG: Outer membrane porin F precursor [Syntrophorhabdus sp. PtaU1.Bin002]